MNPIAHATYTKDTGRTLERPLEAGGNSYSIMQYGLRIPLFTQAEVRRFTKSGGFDIDLVATAPKTAKSAVVTKPEEEAN